MQYPIILAVPAYALFLGVCRILRSSREFGIFILQLVPGFFLIVCFSSAQEPSALLSLPARSNAIDYAGGKESFEGVVNVFSPCPGGLCYFASGRTAGVVGQVFDDLGLDFEVFCIVRGGGFAQESGPGWGFRIVGLKGEGERLWVHGELVVFGDHQGGVLADSLECDWAFRGGKPVTS